ncbi:MAG: hypothetical protein C0618_08615 [Desulfuromonas sp.]|nr:MAG: hypothetical protein C0618_08615 [Desulfuromonas sp.]
MKGLLLAGCLLLFSTTVATADWGPWRTPENPPHLSHTQGKDTGPLDTLVRFFQKYISPVDGARCPMFPTCSAYSRQALKKHGPLIGTMMTVDRLFREADPLEKQTPIIKWGHQRYLDPVSDNDFWWLRPASPPAKT